MLILVAMILLISTQGLSQESTLDLKPWASVKRDQIAEKLKEGEICERNYDDTRRALDECTASIGDADVVFHVIMGVATGVVLTFIACSSSHGCN